jgi:hypothetical protein
VFSDSLVPPEWLMLTCIGLVFIWGFSKREPVDEIEAIAEQTK